MQSIELQQQSDESLMLAYQQGNTRAFDVLYSRHRAGLYRYLLRQLDHQVALTDELFQEVWMKLIHGRENYQASAKFSTYLYRVAYHRLVDHWRRGNVTMTQPLDDEALANTDPQPQQSLEAENMAAELKQAIASLPEEQRNAFLLKEEGALALEVIAEVTGVNRETVKSRLRYAVKRLRQVLSPLRSVT